MPNKPNRKSESLMGESLNPPPPRQMTREEIQSRSKQIREDAKKDYLFKKELKERFGQHEQFVSEQQGRSQHSSIIGELTALREHVSHQELKIIQRVNERKKRHYSLNGDVVVYCYVKNNWPQVIVRPLTISLDESLPILPIDGYEDENEIVVKAIFKPITVGVKNRIDHFIYEPNSDNDMRLLMNYDEYKKLSFSCCFKSWNLPIDLEFEDGRLTQKSIDMIEHSIHPRLFDIIAGEFVRLNDISDDETKVLDQQCERLFSKNSKGVSNPAEGIRLYCEASAMAKEFYLSGGDLENLPYRVSTMIRFVANKGNEIHIRQMDSGSKPSQKGAKVIGARRGKR